jgi:hypothetical protein
MHGQPEPATRRRAILSLKEALVQIVALDVHICGITAALLDLEGAEAGTVMRRSCTDPAGIGELGRSLQRDDVVLGVATTNAFWLY